MLTGKYNCMVQLIVAAVVVQGWVLRKKPGKEDKVARDAQEL